MRYPITIYDPFPPLSPLLRSPPTHSVHSFTIPPFPPTTKDPNPIMWGGGRGGGESIGPLGGNNNFFFFTFRLFAPTTLYPSPHDPSTSDNGAVGGGGWADISIREPEVWTATFTYRDQELPRVILFFPGFFFGGGGEGLRTPYPLVNFFFRGSVLLLPSFPAKRWRFFHCSLFFSGFLPFWVSFEAGKNRPSLDRISLAQLGKGSLFTLFLLGKEFSRYLPPPPSHSPAPRPPT